MSSTRRRRRLIRWLLARGGWDGQVVFRPNGGDRNRVTVRIVDGHFTWTREDLPSSRDYGWTHGEATQILADLLGYHRDDLRIVAP